MLLPVYIFALSRKKNVNMIKVIFHLLSISRILSQVFWPVYSPSISRQSKTRFLNSKFSFNQCAVKEVYDSFVLEFFSKIPCKRRRLLSKIKQIKLILKKNGDPRELINKTIHLHLKNFNKIKTFGLVKYLFSL